MSLKLYFLSWRIELNPLGINHRRLLRRSSISSITHHFEKLHENLPSDSLLSQTNRYLIDTIDRLKTDSNARSINGPHLCEYISASILSHYIDAHSYFGRAISSLLNGDVLISKHLLYYSELRSAMSVLASNGIGVFSTKNFIVEAIDTCNPNSINRNTHDIAWLALDFCFKELNTSNYLLDDLFLEGFSLRDWIDNFQQTALTSTKLAAIESFLNNIGFDLSFFQDDKDARNHVSYRPTSFKSGFSIDYNRVIFEIENIWHLCQPQTYGTEKLDALLLRRLLQVIFKATHRYGFTHKRANKQYENACINMLNGLRFSETTKNKWLELLVEKPEIDSIITTMETQTEVTDKNYVFGMLYRSVFLMRLSSIFIEYHLKNTSSINKNNTELWWETLGKNFGLFEDSSQISFFSDLWQDIEISLKDLEEWKKNTNSVSPHSLSNAPNIFPKLATFEPVGLWNISL